MREKDMSKNGMVKETMSRDAMSNNCRSKDGTGLMG
jgi:hypothetical protein